MAKQAAVDNATLINIQKRVETIPHTALGAELQRNAQILSQQPKNPALNFGVGLMYARIGDFASATKVLERSLKLSKNNEIILGSLAFLHANQIGDHETAIKYLQKKLRLNAKDGPAHLLIASSYLNIGEPEKALEAINKAEPLVSDEIKPRVKAMRSQCFQRIGDFDKARDELLEISKQDALGLTAVADILSRLPGNPPELTTQLKSTMEESLEAGENQFRSPVHKATTTVALANLLEANKEYSKAFSWFKKANEFAGRDESAWSSKDTSEFDILKGVFDKELFETLPKGDPSAKQIFIIGMPRSGTTLLESILGAHSSVKDHGELEFFIEHQHRMGFTVQKSPDVKARIEYLSKLLRAAPKEGLTDLAKAYRQRYGMHKQPSAFHVDKLPHNFRALGLIAAVFPNAKIIHAQRHPMDVCMSNFKTLLPGYNTTFGQNLDSIGTFYREYTALMKHWADVLPLDIHNVRYEELVASPETLGEELVSFCGIKWNADSLSDRKQKSDVNTASMWQVREDIYTSSVHKWRNYEQELAPLAKVLSSEITEYENQ
jgi:tetratricopeptide (TPR) repeat protein